MSLMMIQEHLLLLLIQWVGRFQGPSLMWKLFKTAAVVCYNQLVSGSFRDLHVAGIFFLIQVPKKILYIHLFLKSLHPQLLPLIFQMPKHFRKEFFKMEANFMLQDIYEKISPFILQLMIGSILCQM